ncbi:chitinase 4-like [Dendrobium catenatum]|uniref:chitinase 4-like n=1 Tax=Dendrobium catenatum TaxID=906689 RepID=UPI00109FAC51|nr:chitinase 4-like [Dendrobium catenatum]
MDGVKPSFLIPLLLIIAAGELIAGQNCGCAYLVSQEFFDELTSLANPNCDQGNGFYTRDAFLNAWQSYPGFADSPSIDDSKREIAAFFAHVSHETTRMCFKDQADKSSPYCDPKAQEYPCTPGKMYYGRGPLQISWNYNYGPAGQEIGFDGLNWPEAVSTDAIISFKTALWFWMRNVHGIISQGFGATIQAIDGVVECGGGSQDAVNDRVNLYQNYCDQFNVSPGDNLYC